MRQFLLTTALLLPLAGLALAQTNATAPAAGPAAEETPANATPAEIAAQKAAEAARNAAEAAAVAAGSAAEAAKAAIDEKAAKVEEKAAEIKAGAADAEAKLADTAEARAALQAEMAASDKIVRQQAANELRVAWIDGALVKSPDGDDIGQVRDVIVDASSGQMIAAIVGVGGLLGIGEKQIAVPWSQLTVNSDAQTITTTLTAKEAMAAPDYAFRKREPAKPAPKKDTHAAEGAEVAKPEAAKVEEIVVTPEPAPETAPIAEPPSEAQPNSVAR